MRQVSSIRTEQRLGDSFFPSLKTSKQLVVLSLELYSYYLVVVLHEMEKKDWWWSKDVKFLSNPLNFLDRTIEEAFNKRVVRQIEERN